MFKSILIGLLAITLVQCQFQSNDSSKKPKSPKRVPAAVVEPIQIETKLTENSGQAMKSPYVVLVSIDGFRHDYAKKYGADNLLAIGERGIQARSLQPVFPSLTFPNHYSIVTGMYAENHEIVSNGFFDPETNRHYSLMDGEAVRDGSWYKGEPLWVVADKNQMVSASYFWVGSEAEISGRRPTYYKNYDGSVSNLERVDQVVEWLKLPALERPHFITLYFSMVDSAGHYHGTESEEVKEAVIEADLLVGHLRQEIQKLNLPINLIIVSDHGMQDLDEEKVIYLNDYADFKGFEVQGRGALMHIYSEDSQKIDALYSKLVRQSPDFDVYKREDIPESLNYRKTNKVGDLIIQPKLPYYLKMERPEEGKSPLSKPATHGWDPRNKNMHGILYGEGPQLTPGVELDSLENIHIYPLVLKILGLKTDAKYDGDFSVISEAYRP